MSQRKLRLLAERQHGLVTTRDISELLTRERGRSAERLGWLIEVRPHVYRLSGAQPTWKQAVMAAVLVAGRHAVASHVTAAALWRLPGFPAGSATPIEVTVPRGRRPQLDEIAVHQTIIGPGCHAARVDRVPVTDAARTLCDLDGVVSRDVLGGLVDDALMRKLVTIAALNETFAELRQGSRRSRGMARVLAERGVEWDDADSPPEARLVRWLVEAGLPQPVQQERIDRFRVDLAYPGRGVFIEYDGFDAHVTRTAFDHDRRRGNALALRPGAIVLRFTSSSTREEVVRDVTAALERTAAA
jgi:very-short-patch-repair endonuclease